MSLISKQRSPDSVAALACLILAAGLSLTPSTAAAAAASASPFADAVEKSDRAGVRGLIRQKVDVNAAQADGMTALHWAAQFDDLEMAKLLLKSGARVTTNRYGVTPLSLACVNGNGEMVELFLAAGADPNTTLRGGETALMTAARTGKPGAVKALLAHGAVVDAKERRGQTALMWAAADGHAAVVELLIQAGADFRSGLPDSGFTPLLFAAREGRAEVARVLLKAGADVNEAVQPRKASGKGPAKGTSALILAVENGHYELALALIEAGADPNDQRSGYTPLHVMSWVRKPNRGEDDGAPPPLGSGNLDSVQFIRKLVAHGADVNARLKTGRGGAGLYNKVGATPFLMASATADAVYMKLLVELGANPALGNVDGCMPIIVACGIGIGSAAANEVAGEEPEVLEAAQLLLDLGADVNAVDANGETAMHGAAYRNHPKVVQFLADKGAKIEIWNKKNKYGWTPLLIAEGHRPGNFKPSVETIEALHRVMKSAGVTLPTSAASNSAAGGDDYSGGDAARDTGEREGTAKIVHRTDVVPDRSTNQMTRGGLWPLYTTPEAHMNYFEVTGRSQLHFHPDAEHRLYVLEGKVVVTSGTNVTTAVVGDFIVIPKGVRHCYDVPVKGDRALLLTFDAPPFDPRKTVNIESPPRSP